MGIVRSTRESNPKIKPLPSGSSRQHPIDLTDEKVEVVCVYCLETARVSKRRAAKHTCASCISSDDESTTIDDEPEEEASEFELEILELSVEVERNNRKAWTCQFCGDECNPDSQACGSCMRDASIWGPPIPSCTHWRGGFCEKCEGKRFIIVDGNELPCAQCVCHEKGCIGLAEGDDGALDADIMAAFDSPES